MYLPWVLAVFNMVIQGGYVSELTLPLCKLHFKSLTSFIYFDCSGIMELIGIFVGHLYFFLMFKYPQDFGGQRFLSTPSILYVVWLILHCTFSIVHFPLYIFHCFVGLFFYLE